MAMAMAAAAAAAAATATASCATLCEGKVEVREQQAGGAFKRGLPPAAVEPVVSTQGGGGGGGVLLWLAGTPPSSSRSGAAAARSKEVAFWDFREFGGEAEHVVLFVATRAVAQQRRFRVTAAATNRAHGVFQQIVAVAVAVVVVLVVVDTTAAIVASHANCGICTCGWRRDPRIAIACWC